MKSFRLMSVAALLVSFSLLGCGDKTEPTEKQNKNNQNQQTDKNIDAPLQYPELYTNEKLPQFQKATLINTGRQTTSLKDGLALDLTSTEPVQTIAKFYEQELKDLGWTVPEPKFRSDDMFGANCTKGNLKYNIIITKIPNGKPTKIHISFLSE